MGLCLCLPKIFCWSGVHPFLKIQFNFVFSWTVVDLMDPRSLLTTMNQLMILATMTSLELTVELFPEEKTSQLPRKWNRLKSYLRSYLLTMKALHVYWGHNNVMHCSTRFHFFRRLKRRKTLFTQGDVQKFFPFGLFIMWNTKAVYLFDFNLRRTKWVCVVCTTTKLFLLQTSILLERVCYSDSAVLILHRHFNYLQKV